MSKKSRNRFGKKPHAETTLIEDTDCEDSIYYELDNNGQMIRSRPKESGDDSIYYALDEKGEFIRSEPSPNVEGKASFSKDSENVTLNTAESSGMFQKIYNCLDV